MNYSTPQDRIAFLSSLPGAVGDIVQLIEQNAGNEQGAELVQFVVSFLHPDMVCSLSLLQSLPETSKTAVSRFFLYAIDDGLPPQLSAQLYDFLTPHLMGHFRPR
ncbi:MAG: hypothetical protein GAK35_04300 [Herbaspirillum frisingense]|uniref:Uncharacterized protein n=1 Tax=Herbaspirillum frisingense TaxID=92645 RepID=A0A7V8FSL2_9BURK|nr:MAG: hypothetical protein GAK35_04300 [Herbaspirillum frisingense]